MEKRVVGKSGIEISVMGIGGWSYGGGDYWGPQAQEDVDAVAHAALDHGINFFDTAEGYNEGRSEEAVGRALKGRRSEAIVATKISPNNTEPTVLREHCEDSLRRLQTDYIDIYIVHWPITEHSVEDAFATLTALKEEGKIRSIGVSNFGVEQLSEALATGVQLDVNQLCYNLLSRAIELEILPLCQQHGMGILGYMPLLQGLLTGMYQDGGGTSGCPCAVPAVSRGSGKSRDMAKKGLRRRCSLPLKVSEKSLRTEGVPMSRLAIAWTIAKPGITCELVGTRNVSELEENLHVASLSLSPETIAKLDELTTSLLQKLGANADYFLARRTH